MRWDTVVTTNPTGCEDEGVSAEGQLHILISRILDRHLAMPLPRLTTPYTSPNPCASLTATNEPCLAFLGYRALLGRPPKPSITSGGSIWPKFVPQIMY